MKLHKEQKWECLNKWQTNKAQLKVEEKLAAKIENALFL